MSDLRKAAHALDLMPNEASEYISVSKVVKCEARVWDNGDQIDCGSPLPCEAHPESEMRAKDAVDKIHRRLGQPFKLGEKWTDRLGDVAALVSEGLTSQRRSDST